MASSRGRSRFQADLKSATEKNHTNITRLGKGDAEDELTFVFSHANLPFPSQIEIRAQPQDIRGYPSDNYFLIYTNDDIPPAVARVLDESISETMGMRVDTMLSNISQRVRAVLKSNEFTEGDDIAMSDAEELSSEMEDTDSIDEDISFEGVEDDYDDNLFNDEPTPARRRDSSPSPTVPITPLLLNRLRQDLLSVHQAGFHAGKASGFGGSGFNDIISISLRARELCLSKETREAWYLAPSDYIVLLIRYGREYTTVDDIMKKDPTGCKVSFRLRKCSKKKPSHQQANAAFSSDLAQNNSEGTQEDPVLSDIWISRPIEELLNSEFLMMLKFKKNNGCSWDSAKENWRSALLGSSTHTKKLVDAVDQGELSNEEQNYKTKLPSFLTVDHLSGDGELSLPLIVMQFALLYLVRCTDYCTACRCKVKGNFKALRPYVCSSPLCLHQYMNLGFGPSIEYEIVNQPNVVDLLVSFCYASLYARISSTAGGIREFPTGLNLRVPKIRKVVSRASYENIYLDPLGRRCVETPSALLIDPMEVDFDWDNSTATIICKTNMADLEEGQWVVVSTPVPISLHPFPKDQTVLHHARVVSNINNSLNLNVVSQHLIPSFTQNVGIDISTIRGWASNKSIRGYIVTYDDDLDDISDEYQKAFSMMIILESLPSVTDMRTHLMSNQLQQPALARWNKMSGAAVNLLRWIISSNRSYIVQVGEEQTDTRRRGEKIYGIDGWLQFRFVQGSPEKEELFRQALEPIDKPQKTLLAFHGSPLGNWHSIIRQGLDFSRTLHGRSYGNGIYFSRIFDTSQGYTHFDTRNLNAPEIWPRSSLRIQAAVSLNELVNRPNDFVSSDPFFVVQNCHWTQCRYLFVKCTAQPSIQNYTSKITPTTPEVVSKVVEPEQGPEFVQDPQWVTRGLRGSKLFVPKYAFPSARDGCDDTAGSLKNEVGEPEIVSSDEDEEDVKFLYPEYETDFRPGTLDLSTLPKLAPPSNATETAQKALGQEIKKLQKLQSTIPPHLLGWYVNFDENMFQWIVELHSFEPTLPLAVDMKNAGLTSIVLEIRFLPSFPISPPFVRVVRPRFLPFMQGGGGHVTSGGALCMELLTNSGWSPANSLESVLLQVRMAICSVDPRPARLENTNLAKTDYSIADAVTAYKRAAAAHGWELPKDFLGASLSQLTTVSRRD
ncbi:hypothetical protein F4776DRAFT_629828 [Hypoxylon sp. NC0597]|nr:hypothetical protein F4776DRAFT_629828 [Hypoxylon sp. NC0597]